MSEHLILGATHSAAANDARKWGWEPAALRIRGRLAFISPDGEAALVSSRLRDLHFVNKDATIYLADGWVFAFGGDPRGELRAHIRAGGKVCRARWKSGELVGFDELTPNDF